jgi:AraC family transcriptional regulator
MSAQNNPLLPESVGQIGSACSLGDSDLVRVAVMTDAPGVIEVPGQENPRVVINAGKPVRVACQRGGETHTGIAVYGDIDIVPAGVASRWELNATERFLTLGVSRRLLERVAESSGLDAAHIEIHNRFQIRHPQMEHIGWALKAEVDQGSPSGRLYMESMAIALAIEVLRNRGLRIETSHQKNSGFSRRGLKQVLAYIDENLGEDLTIQAIADEMGISGSSLKQIFRNSFGVPLHQYVIRRRVERAADLLSHRKMGINQVALETGFSSQSHLAMHMRRLLGASPKDLRRG